MVIRCAAVLVVFGVLVNAAEIRGKVSSVIRGEPLARVQVFVLETGDSATTSSDGTFRIQSLESGEYTLKVNVVGYRLLTTPATLSSPEDVKELEINLTPDNFRHTDTVEVRGDVFQGADPVSVNELNLTSTEIRESSTWQIFIEGECGWLPVLDHASIIVQL